MTEDSDKFTNYECVHALNGIKNLMFAATERADSNPIAASEVSQLAFAIGIIADRLANHEGIY